MNWAKITRCPSCGSSQIEIAPTNQETHSLDPVVMASLFCPNCMFKHRDVTILNIKRLGMVIKGMRFSLS